MAAFDAKAFLKTLTPLPGVYRMLDVQGTVLYIGKARNLKRRVASYFRATPSSAKIQSLVAQIAQVDVTVTHTEGEALILESTLIKQYQPRYNVLLRDDKGYPYIHLSAGKFPRLSLHRGARRAGGQYFGPYPNVSAVRETLHLMQRVFKLRQCEDSFFNNRSRPCLQYQIKRCTAPCTGLIDQAGYQGDVEHVARFLDGKSDQVINDLVGQMEAAAGALRYEQAALYRDQIMQLRQIQERQHVVGAKGNLDLIAAVVEGGAACVQVFFYRDGRLLGNNAYFPRIPQDESVTGVIGAFLPQFYLDKPIPDEILADPEPDELALLTEVLGQRAGRKIVLSTRVRGERARWLEMAQHNASLALRAQLASQAGLQRRFGALQEALQLDESPTRLECFDISHTQGEATVASCVVFNQDGPLKSDYRRYNIEDITPGDDYGAMRQVLTRRYTRLREDDAKLPEVVFIDGGKGQLRQAQDVLAELQIDAITLVGVAKGPQRKAGLEMLYLAASRTPVILPADSAALHLIQQIRDEAHRFAITAHRQRRAKARRTSVLEHVPGIGAKRRQRLLKQFGGLQQLARAGVEDIARVDGVSKDLAQRIYDAFHSNG